MTKKKREERTYIQQTYVDGLAWIWTAAVVLLMVPAAICIYYDSWPGITPVLKGLIGVAPIFWTVGFIEVVTFIPMLGTAGSFLGFVTGNISYSVSREYLYKNGRVWLHTIQATYCYRGLTSRPR